MYKALALSRTTNRVVEADLWIGQSLPTEGVITVRLVDSGEAFNTDASDLIWY